MPDRVEPQAGPASPAVDLLSSKETSTSPRGGRHQGLVPRGELRGTLLLGSSNVSVHPSATAATESPNLPRMSSRRGRPPQSSEASCNSAPITMSSCVAPCSITKAATESQMGEIGDPCALPDLVGVDRACLGDGVVEPRRKHNRAGQSGPP